MLFYNGKRYYTPQAIGFLSVEGAPGGTLADFNVGVIVADSPMGCPYNAVKYNENSTDEALGVDEIFNLYSSKDALVRDYGDGDILTKFLYGKKTGLGAVFVLNTRPNTQAYCALDDDSDDALIIKPRKHLYGAAGNWISIAVIESYSTEILDSGTASGAATGTLIDSSKTWTDDQWNDKWVVITGGTGKGQARKISDTVASTDTINVSPNWSVTPDTTSTYEIVEALFTYNFTPPKFVKSLGANAASGAMSIYVKGKDGLFPGQKINIASNAGDIEEIEIVSVDKKYTSNGYKVVLKSALTNSYTTANYGMLFSKDTARTESFPFIGAQHNLDNIVATINSAFVFVEVEPASGATNPPIAAAESYLGDVTGATLGTSPATSSTDFTNIAGSLRDWVTQFEAVNKVTFRGFDIGTHDSSVHGVFRDAGVDLRKNLFKPIQIVSGVNLGDILISGQANTNPTYRAKNLNSKEIQLCAIGLDGLPAYLTTASEVFAIRMSNSPLHNATRDTIVADSLEKILTPDEVTAMLRGGVTVPAVNKFGRYIAHSINTYQDQESQWNQEDTSSYLTAQMDKADFVFVSLLEYMDRIGVGVDASREQITAAVDTFLTDKFIPDGYVTGYTIEQEEAEGTVINRIKIKLPDQIDYAVLLLAIQTGDF